MSRGKDKLVRVRTGNAQSRNPSKAVSRVYMQSSLFSDVRRLID
jgi:hypothetical protein